MIKIIELRTIDNLVVFINIDAIESIFEETKNKYGILMRTGVIYYIDNNWYQQLIERIR